MDAGEWDRRYAAAPQWAAEPARIVTQVLGALPPASAVDLACGDGRNTRWLAARGWAVTAVDFSAEALRIAAARMPQDAPARFVQGDALTWAPEAPVGLVLVTYLQLPSADLTAVLGRAATWLEPGGHLIVLGHDRENLTTGAPGPRDPAVLHTPELLAEAVPTLHIERCERIHRAEAETSVGDPAPVAIDTLLVAVRAGA